MCSDLSYICSDLASFSETSTPSNLDLADIAYEKRMEHDKCSCLVLDCLYSVACLDSSPNCWLVLAKTVLEIDSDQIFCVCFFLDVHLKIVAGASPCIGMKLEDHKIEISRANVLCQKKNSFSTIHNSDTHKIDRSLLAQSCETCAKFLPNTWRAHFHLKKVMERLSFKIFKAL